MIEPVRTQMAIRHMRISCLIPKTINTHSEYVIHIAFPLQQWLHERATILHYSTRTLPVLLIISTVRGLTHCHMNSSFGQYLGACCRNMFSRKTTLHSLRS